MASLSTDWRNYPRGIYPEDWLATWTTLPTCRVSGTDLEPADSLEIFGETVATRRGLAWAIWDGQSGRSTQEVLALVYVDTTGASETPLVHVRMGGTAGSENGYYVAIGTSTLILKKLSAGALSTLGSAALTIPAKSYWWVRTGATGTTIRTRAWAAGSAEPGAWTVTVTDASFADGRIGVGVYDAGTAVRYFFYSVGINGDPAPDQSALPKRLHETLKDPAAKVEFWLRLAYADPATGTVYTQWVSQEGRGRVATGDLSFPPTVAMMPILSDPGSVSFNLSQDAMFSGAVAGSSSFTVTINNSDGPLAFLGQATPGGAPTYALAGLRQTVYAGDAAGPTRGFEPLYSAKCSAEPILAATLTLQLASDEDRLSTKLAISSYAGIRTCQRYNGGNASAPHLAAYDLTEFTVMGRFRITGTPGAGTFPSIINKEINSANRNFFVFVNPVGSATPGRVSGATSSGGVASKNRINSNNTYVDGKWYAAVYAHSAINGNYLFIVGNGVEEITTGTSEGDPNVQNAPVTWGTSMVNGDTCDQRIYNYWMTPDEARTALGTLAATAGDSALLSAWVGDDGSSGSTPTVVTDYGVWANNAAITGTFAWVASDLGDSSLVGKLRPIAYGHLRQASPDRSDPVRSRYTYNDGEIADPLTTKSRGAVLTRGTDFSSPPSGGTDTSYQGSGVFFFAGANPDPVTVDFTGTGSVLGDAAYYPGRLCRTILTTRGDQVLHRDIDSGWCEAMARLAPYPTGFFRKGGGTAPQQTEVANEILGGSGQSWRLDRDDRFAPCQLLPTILPGPYGNDYCLEFCGHPRQEVLFPAFAVPSSSLTVCGWVYSLQTESDPAADNSIIFNGQVLLQVGLATDPRIATVLTPNFYASRGQIQHGFSQAGISSSSILTNPGLIPWAGWTFVAISYLLNTSFTVYAAPLGSALAQVPAATASFPGPYLPPNAGTGDLRLGNSTAGAIFLGSLQHWQIWNSAKNLSQLQALMTTPPAGNESGLLFYAPLTESSGPPVDLVSGKSAIWGNVRRTPHAVLDYTVSGDSIGKFGGPMALKPAYEAIVNYNVAEQPLQEADIATGVTGAARELLKQPSQLARFYSSAIRYDPVTGKGYRMAKSLSVSSRFASAAWPSVLSKTMGYRFSPARKTATVTDLPRSAMDAQVLDEILIKAGAHTGLPAIGQSYRIVQISNAYATGKSTLGLWR